MAHRKLMLGLVITVVAAVTTGYTGRMLVQHLENEMMEDKAARENEHETTGVIVDRKQVRFEAGQTSYIDDQGKTTALDDGRRNSGEFRVYYKINDFNQMPGSMRGGLARGDQAREKRFGPRFAIVDERTYDRAQVGHPVIVRYHWASDSEIYVIAVDLANEHSQEKPPSALPMSGL